MFQKQRWIRNPVSWKKFWYLFTDIDNFSFKERIETHTFLKHTLVRFYWIKNWWGLKSFLNYRNTVEPFWFRSCPQIGFHPFYKEKLFNWSRVDRNNKNLSLKLKIEYLITKSVMKELDLYEHIENIFSYICRNRIETEYYLHILLIYFQCFVNLPMKYKFIIKEN